jgi:hypothetical protein
MLQQSLKQLKGPLRTIINEFKVEKSYDSIKKGLKITLEYKTFEKCFEIDEKEIN